MNNIDYMSSAYKLLYEIETTLKQNIELTLEKHYGVNWQHILRVNRDFKTAFFHELISYYGKYPPLTSIFTTSERNQLYQIVNTRNKIAHMKIISNEEYEMLVKCKKLVKVKLTADKEILQLSK
ncbi:hypothetical protein [Ornithinibacillus halophilus]|uniref:Swt1-like HEPN domain-containing protein n=1 Tax=Ornithinibacillus halophilus TaxID=930117 RepID=A0A1M5G2J8_9BACI|nr:hypothetical protein [Ornithinibacillus halophilus]SHF97949.1 hypothetical protein SAMN05216225_101138 [Ornithinibacillus halophilus]